MFARLRMSCASTAALAGELFIVLVNFQTLIVVVAIRFSIESVAEFAVPAILANEQRLECVTLACEL